MKNKKHKILSQFIYLSIVSMLIFYCSDSSNIAKVNGESISQAEFSAYLKHKRIPQQDERRVNSALKQYLEREALASIIKNENYLDNELIAMEVQEFEKQVLISRYFEKFLKDEVDEESIRNHYISNQASYESKQVEVAHILFRISKQAPETERKVILTTAQEAYSKLQRGDDFSEIAKQYSDDKVSLKRDGNLGWIKEGAIDADFSNKVFSMKAGEISEPFATSFGFQIVKILSESQIIKQPLESVSGDIRYRLKSQSKKNEIKRLIENANIKNYRDEPAL